MSKKILIVTGIYPPEIGGPANYSRTLARELVDRGLDVSLLAYSNKGNFEDDKKEKYKITRVFRSGNKLFTYLEFFIKAFPLILNSEVIYSLDWFSAGFPIYIISLITGKKYILRIGGSYIWEKYLQEGNPPMTLAQFYEKGVYKNYPVMHFLITKVLRRASWVVFNSDVQRKRYADFYNIKEKTSVIKNAVPKPEYTEEYLPKEKVIIFIGRFIVMKNIESAIRAFALLRDKSFKLRLIGNGPNENRLREVVKELDLNERVTFEDALPKEKIYSSIRSCYYVILPTWTDVSPNEVYACLSNRIPVLLTKENYLGLPFNPEFLVDPSSIEDIKNKMHSLFDENIYSKFRHDFFSVNFSHTWDEVVKEHLDIFGKIYK